MNNQWRSNVDKDIRNYIICPIKFVGGIMWRIMTIMYGILFCLESWHQQMD